MSKRAPNIEWYVAKDDLEWTHLCPQSVQAIAPSTTPVANGHLWLQRLLGGVALLVCLLAGGWWWRTDQVTWPQGEAEVAQDNSSLVARELDPPSASVQRHQGGRELNQLNAATKTAQSPAYLFEAEQSFEVQGDSAVSRVVVYTEHGEPTYRQTRFYQNTERGWQQTPPNAALWGPKRSLATPSLIFHFRQHDAPVVTEVAPQVEEIYSTLRRNVGLALTSGAEKLVIEVSVTQTPGYVTPWFGAPEHIIVPSPAVYWTPVEMTDAELLSQSIALPLLEQVLAGASEHYRPKAAWQPMMDGLRLWQLWDLDVPLAAWREEVIKWVYADLPNSRPAQAVVLPDRYTALCAAHQLWLPSPVQINIPLLCAEIAWEEFLSSPWGWYDPLTRLEQLGVPLRLGEYLEEPVSLRVVYHPGRTVALATLIEYAVAAYGQERLPTLLAGLGQYDSWDALLLAVYGVSPGEFEAGWQAYLAAHYRVVENEVGK